MNSETICKNHSDIEAGYFLVDQPWIKFCSNCALNMALCGKKIEKLLSSHQFQRKMMLTTIFNQIKRVIEMHSENNVNLNPCIQELQLKYSKQITQKLRLIDDHISNLMKVRDQIVQIYENQMAKKLNIFFDKQSKSIVNSMELKKQIDYVQSNFGNLIEIKDDQIFQDKISFWNQLLHTSKTNLTNESQLLTLEREFKIALSSINAKLNSLQKLSIIQNHCQKISDTKGQKQNDRRTQRKNIILTDTSRQKKTQLKLRSVSKKPQKIKTRYSYYNEGKKKIGKELTSLNSSLHCQTLKH